MIKIENVEVTGWKHAIRGMRNPMNSWDKSDSTYINENWCDTSSQFALAEVCGGNAPMIGDADYNIMLRLAKAGSVEGKFRRMIIVYVDITAPLYWWKEFDTYKVGTVVNSCSTMHKIHAKEFTLDDFSHEHLIEFTHLPHPDFMVDPLEYTISHLNTARLLYLETGKKEYWWQMIQLLPSSYNQKRTVMLNYEVLANICINRRNHKLDEWRELCQWIEGLPYSDIITCNVWETC